MERNQLLARPAADGCVRRWKEGGCRHCPRWSELGELWRGAAERRRGGRFVPLAPSTDPEWEGLLAAAQAEAALQPALQPPAACPFHMPAGVPAWRVAAAAAALLVGLYALRRRA